jgi:type II secretory pathway pseudopilin PulG
MKKSKQFTIIEMVVVLAIISLIVGMLLTGIGIARESARETRAKAEMQQIKMAVTQYLSTFKQLPTPASNAASFNSKDDASEWAEMLAFLDGSNNTRNQSFLKGSITLSPWAKGYNIVMDDDWNNQVSANGSDIADRVALWCEDKDSDEINTWE